MDTSQVSDKFFINWIGCQHGEDTGMVFVNVWHEPLDFINNSNLKCPTTSGNIIMVVICKEKWELG